MEWRWKLVSKEYDDVSLVVKQVGNVVTVLINDVVSHTISMVVNDEAFNSVVNPGLELMVKFCKYHRFPV